MRNSIHILAKTGGNLLVAGALAFALTGCGTDADATATNSTQQSTEAAAESANTVADTTAAALTTTAPTTDGVVDTTDLFSERDLMQVADTSDATQLTLTSGSDLTITDEGVYVISGEATETTIVVNATDDAKVQLVLDGVSIANTDSPAIYVQNADKVFVTTIAGTNNTLTVSGSFVADGDTNTDAAIFSKDDLVLNGQGTLTIDSSSNGITSKDDLKVTGGAYVITSAADAIEANDTIAIADGSFTISSSKDGLHAEDSDDDTQGSVYICGGSFVIDAAGDAIQAATYLQIDDGTLQLSASEALEATYVQVNGGSLDISASDDGINASSKSSAVGTPTIEIRGGDIRIEMASGDTDALDVNGNLVVSGGTLDITAQFAFDFDGTASFTGGSITVNGEQVTEITNSMMMDGGTGGAPAGGTGGMPGGEGNEDMQGFPGGGPRGNMGNMQG